RAGNPERHGRAGRCQLDHPGRRPGRTTRGGRALGRAASPYAACLAPRQGTRGTRAAGRGGRARRSEPNPQRDRVGGRTHRAADRRRANAGRGGERRNGRGDVEFAPGGRRPGPRVDPGPRVRRLLLLLCAVGACRAAALPEAQLFPTGTQFTARYLRVEGARIRYIDAGRGAPVVFLHGLGASMYAWRNNLGAVAAAGFRVIAFDNRGFGLSDKPPAPYDNAAYARLAIAFMDSLGLPDAVLVGHSMGGAIAAEVAIEHPPRVRGLILVGSAGLGTREPLLFRVVRWPVLGPAVLAFRLPQRAARWPLGPGGGARRSEPPPHRVPEGRPATDPRGSGARAVVAYISQPAG